MLEYVSYQNGNPDRMVIFLHGYNGTITDHQYAIDWLHAELKNSIIIIPQAPEVSDKNPLKKQWFGMLKYDSENRRSMPETSSEDIFAIYNSAAKEIKHCAQSINQFIDSLQQKYHFDDSSTYLIGFSQGAMLTIYTALTRSAPLAGAFALSGLVAGTDSLSSDMKSHPPLYLFHGQEDMKVQYKTLSQSIEWLKHQSVIPSVHIYPELAHKICKDEISKIANIINN